MFLRKYFFSNFVGEAGRFFVVRGSGLHYPLFVVFLASSVDLGTATNFAPVPRGLASSRFRHTVAIVSCLVSPHSIGFLMSLPLERVADELIDL